jgi:hypothetical protein
MELILGALVEFLQVIFVMPEYTFLAKELILQIYEIMLGIMLRREQIKGKILQRFQK